MATLPEGFAVGHWTDPDAATGCTVILCPPRTAAGCDVRGNSPGSRELALLASEKSMQEVHAVLLTGGSAFGLAAADGVMRYLEERGTGYWTPWATVPIVPAAVVYDLNVGSNARRPTAEDGYAACLAAASSPVLEGSVGAGTGATVGKWAGLDARMKGGIGAASVKLEALEVAALVVVNAVGDILGEDGSILAGARTKEGVWVARDDPHRQSIASTFRRPSIENTTLAVVLTNARLSKVDCNRAAQRGHDGLARSIKPVHTSFDGDIVFALATGAVECRVDLVAEAGADMIAAAVRSAVRSASAVDGIPSLG